MPLMTREEEAIFYAKHLGIEAERKNELKSTLEQLFQTANQYETSLNIAIHCSNECIAKNMNAEVVFFENMIRRYNARLAGIKVFIEAVQTMKQVLGSAD